MPRISKEYAVALFALAKENNQTSEVSDGLKLVRSVFEQTPDLYLFLKSPGISMQTRLDTIKESFGSDVPEYVVSFLSVLCQRGDTDLFVECAEEYEKIYGDSINVCHTVVTSAAPLTDSEKERLCKKLSGKVNKQIEVEYKIDKTLLGGLTVEMDGVIIDGSLKHRMQMMKEVMDE